MPRKRRVPRDTQVYKLPLYGAIVTIDYDASNPPPFFQPGPGVVIVGEHACGGALNAPSAAAPPESGLSREEIIEWQQKRETPTKKKPFSSEDAAIAAGFNPNVVSFEAVAAQAEALPPAESAVE